MSYPRSVRQCQLYMFFLLQTTVRHLCTVSLCVCVCVSVATLEVFFILLILLPSPPLPTLQSRVDEGSVLTKTVYSGNLSSSRKCQECSTLNSKMAKKCVQCRSPLQGRPCPRCSRPNHNHSTECYKCGAALPSTTTKWVIGNKSKFFYV